MCNQNNSDVCELLSRWPILCAIIIREWVISVSHGFVDRCLLIHRPTPEEALKWAESLDALLSHKCKICLIRYDSCVDLCTAAAVTAVLNHVVYPH